MDVRLARPLELHTVKEWVKWLYSNKKLKANLNSYFNREHKILFVRGYQDKELGVVFFQPEDGEISILVNPAHIGKGYGFALLLNAHDWIRRYYSKKDYVWAECVNDASRSLFKEFGYEQDICGDYFYGM